MIKALTKHLKKTNYRCAQKPDGELFLTRDSSNTDLTYMSVERFIDELHKTGLTISPKTLKIGKMTQKRQGQNEIPGTGPSPSPEAAPEEAPEAEDKDPEEVAEEVTEEVEEESELPSFDEMMKMNYNPLKSFADDNGVDFPSAIKKVELQDLVKKKLYS